MILQNEFPVRPLSGQFVRDHGPLLFQIARRVWPRAAGRSSPTLTACDEACKETLNLARARLRDDPESRDEVVSITRLKRCSPEGPRSVDPSGRTKRPACTSENTCSGVDAYPTTSTRQKWLH